MYGRQRWTHDADFFLRDGHDAAIGLEHLRDAGFATQQTDENWIYKGIKRGVLVDLIFKAKGDIYYDEEMIERTQHREFKGRTLPVIPPEDLIMIKAIIHDEATPRHWYDALGIIAGVEIDWDYLLSRSTLGPRRLLSLLVYAQSNDLIVPDRLDPRALRGDLRCLSRRTPTRRRTCKRRSRATDAWASSASPSTSRTG